MEKNYIVRNLWDGKNPGSRKGWKRLSSPLGTNYSDKLLSLIQMIFFYNQGFV